MSFKMKSSPSLMVFRRGVLTAGAGLSLAFKMLRSLTISDFKLRSNFLSTKSHCLLTSSSFPSMFVVASSTFTSTSSALICRSIANRLSSISSNLLSSFSTIISQFMPVALAIFSLSGMSSDADPTNAAGFPRIPSNPRRYSSCAIPFLKLSSPSEVANISRFSLPTVSSSVDESYARPSQLRRLSSDCLLINSTWLEPSSICCSTSGCAGAASLR
mmetsp:Transcript_9652/g.13282  ORF Transcript_9652/g.13282 Transcript_9652/m.13282 type:complete len:216 (+) Transcript_9652:285-932(+)